MLDVVNGKLDYGATGDCDFIGLPTDSIITTVDNDDRTIKAELNFISLPKDENGKYKDGSYLLQAEVSNGKLHLVWTSKGVNSEPCYYGTIVADTLDDVTATAIINTCDVDNVKIDRNIGKQYSYGEVLKGRCLFAYPKAYGDLAMIEFISGTTQWDVTSAFNKVQLDINGVAYYAYVQGSYSTGTYTFAYRFIR